MPRNLRLGILASHPIQYQAPLFRALAERFDLHVFFAHRATAQDQAAAGFGVPFEWDVELLDGYEHSFLTNRAARPGVDRFSGCNTPGIGEALHRGEFDGFIVTGWYLRCYWQAVRACRREGIPVLVRGDSQLGTHRGTLKQAIKRLVFPRVLDRFHGFLYVGSRNREYLLHYGVTESRMFFCPHFVDSEWFAQRAAAMSEDERASLRSAFGAGPGDTVLLFVGKLIKKKRPRDVLDAAHRLHEAGRRVGLVYVGDGPLSGSLRTMARAMAFPVHFAGFKNQTEMPAYYASADLLALPSDGGETWGLVVNEAMACGLPAVVSDAAGCGPDLIDEGRTGATYPVGSVEGLAGAVVKTLGLRMNPDFRVAARDKLSIYSITNAIEGVEAAFERVGGAS